MNKWVEAQEWEKDWHLTQQFNSYNEETKQYIYASKMGLDEFKVNYYGQIGWDFGDMKVLDMGGSGQSILLKAKGDRTVIDPIKPPKWMLERYKAAGIKFVNQKGEEEIEGEYDMVIGMNVLQHCENPEQIVNNILKVSKIVKWFDWIEAGLSDGHIQNLHAEELNRMFGGRGRVEQINRNPVVGLAWYGTFKGELYEE
jgi:2-polyprenyl-3-methyl-5-hydroxy-6-metoxy-1,4-benzoquinol methylase